MDFLEFVLVCASVAISLYTLNRGIMRENIGPFRGTSKIENISKNMHLISMPGVELPWKPTTIPLVMALIGIPNLPAMVTNYFLMHHGHRNRKLSMSHCMIQALASIKPIIISILCT